MPDTKATVYVVPYMVRNKPETERKHEVLAKERGWVKTSLNRDGDEVLSENVGLGETVKKCNLKPNGIDKIDPDKPIGIPVEMEVEIKVPVEAINLTPIETIMPDGVKVGDTVYMDYTITPPTATLQEVTWSVSNPAVLELKDGGEFGELIAVGAGDCDVTALAQDGSGVTAKLTVTVKAVEPKKPVTGIEITNAWSPINLQYYSQNPFTVKAKVTPADATDPSVKWTSSAPAVLTIDPKTGKCTPVKVGKTTITATAQDGSGVKATYEMEVVYMMQRFSVYPNTRDLKIGDSFTLDVGVLPADIGLSQVKFESSDSKSVTVDANGLVTAVAMPSKAVTIKVVNVNQEASSYSCTINVKPEDYEAPAVTGVEILNKDSFLGMAGNEPIPIQLKFTPENAYNTDVAFTSEDDTKIFAKGGSLYIIGDNPPMGTVVNFTVTTADGGFTDTAPFKYEFF